MMIKRISEAIIAAAVLVLVACSKQTDGDKPIERPIRFEPVASLEEVGLPVTMDIAGDTIYISDFFGDSLLNIYNEPDGKHIRSVVGRGQGPSEMMPPIKPMLNHDGMYIYSRSIFTMFRENAGDFGHITKVGNLPTMLSNIFYIGDNRFVASLMPFESEDEKILDRYAMLDDSLRIMYTFGRYPNAGPNEQSDNCEALAHFHQTVNLWRLDSTTLLAVGARDLSFYELGDDGTYRCREIKILRPYDYTVIPGTQYTSTTTALKPGYPHSMSEAMSFHGNILISSMDEDNNSLCFELRDGHTGELLDTFIPDKKIRGPIAVNSRGQILAFSEDENGMTLMRSEPID